MVSLAPASQSMAPWKVKWPCSSVDVQPGSITDTRIFFGPSSTRRWRVKWLT
jgi:hypothetical protein